MQSAVVRAWSDMSTAVQAATGPRGRAVLAQSTSRLLITRSGWQILDLVFASTTDPVQRTLLKCITDHHNTFGDGVKTLVILLNALVTRDISRDIVLKLQNVQETLKTALNAKCDCVLTDDVLHRVIKTFFFTRFAPVVSEILTKLVCDWVGKLESVRYVSEYIANFSSLCVQFSPFSVSSSVVQDGVFIKGLQFKKLPSDEKCCVVKVCYFNLDEQIDEGEVLNEVLDMVSTLERGNPVLFITNLVLQEKVQFLLNFRKIYFIHGVCSELTRFLFEKSLASRNLLVEFQYVVDLLWIKVPKVSQLILKAPNEALSKEYAAGILDCLKMLCFSFKESLCTVAAGGYFEFAFAKMLFHSTKTNCPKFPPVKSREQLVDWQKDNFSFDQDILKHIKSELFADLEPEVKDIICRTLLETAKYRNFNIDKLAIEPLVLKLEILSKALNTLVVLSIDGAVVKPKKGRLI